MLQRGAVHEGCDDAERLVAGRPPRVGRLPKVYEPSDLQLGVTTYSSAIFNFIPEFATRFYAAVRRQDREAVYAGLRDKDKAFEWLEKDFQSRSGRLAEYRWEDQFESLRDDPRFNDLINRMGLPP